MKKCKFCQSEIDNKAKICPNCQKKQGKGILGTIITVFIVLVVFIIIVGSCASNKDDKDDKTSKSAEIVTQNKENDTTKEASINKDKADKTTTESTEAPEASQVLYDQNGITITYKGIEETYMGVDVKVLIENNTDKNYCVQSRDFSINGYMVDTIFSADVASGKKINDSISVFKSALEKNDIDYDSISSIEFYLHIFNWDEFDSSFDSDIISINLK